MYFNARDISAWSVMSQEARGLDPKDWVVPPDQTTLRGQAHWWLYKPIKAASYRRFDDWSEKLAAELAALLDLPAAHVDLAKATTDFGIVSRNVTPDGWSLDSGDTLLSEVPGYVSCATDERQANRIGHNLQNIASVLEGCWGPPSSSCADWLATEVFAGYLVFDAWIANTDRHAINWGVLTRDVDGRRALAASFDHGSALASGTQDAKLEAITVEAYARRGWAGRFEDGARVPLVDLALEAVRLVDGRSDEWLKRLKVLASQDVDQILGAIPEMSEVRRRFLGNLLETNRRRLTS